MSGTEIERTTAQGRTTRWSPAKWISLLALTAFVMTEWLSEISIVHTLQGATLQDAAPTASVSANKNIEVDTGAQFESISSELHEVKNMISKLQYVPPITSSPTAGDEKKEGHDSQHRFHTNALCIPWSKADALNRTMQPFDTWMLHNPHWFVVNETDDQFCVERGDLQNERVRDFLNFYATQFYSSCKKVNWRYQWLSGWG